MPTFSLVQSKNRSMTTGGTNPSETVVFPGNTTAGNFLFCAFCYDNTQATTAVTPSGAGGTWSRIGSVQTDSTDSQNAAMWLAQNITGGSATVTLTATGGPTIVAALTVVIVEFSGVATSALDTSDTAKAFATDNVTSNSISTATVGSQSASFTVGTSGKQSTVQIASFLAASGSNELIVAAYQCGSAQASITPGGGASTADNAIGTSGFTGATGVSWLEVAPAPSGPVPNLYVVKSTLGW